MQLPFVKYSGTGNDFILIDDRGRNFPEHDSSLIKSMCDRHFGIGSDGLMLLREHDEWDFEMIFFNPDSSRSLCGNGSRCSVHFAKELGMAKDSGKFTTTDGIHAYFTPKGDEVEISMSDVGLVQTIQGMDFLNTGSPHLVIRRENLDSMDILSEGRKWRYNDCFADSGGTNVNFIQDIDANTIRVRTYERGVESETWSCGTGVTAAALVKMQNRMGRHRVNVNTKGGGLQVKFVRNESGFSEITLRGPVLKIFEGIYHVGK